MSNPSPVEYGSTTVADIMQAADEYAQHAAFVVKHSDSQNETNLQLARQKLQLLLKLHFGSTEPFATLLNKGGFFSMEIHGDKTSLTEDVPLYRAPQMTPLQMQQFGRALRPDSIKRLEALEKFYAAWRNDRAETAAATWDASARQQQLSEMAAALVPVA